MKPGDATIGRKLTKINLVTSTAALLFTCGAFFAYEYVTFRQNALRNLQTLAEITAANSTAALAFNSPDDARETLSALKADRQIVAAALYNAAGGLFARFPGTQPLDAFPDGPGAAGFQFAHGVLEGFEPVAQGANRSVGTLYLRYDTSAIYARFRLYGLIVALVLGASVLIVIVISRRLQRQISEPLLALAETARAVSDRHDYSVRAPKVDGREMRVLTDAFNQMLEQSQAHERAQTEGRRNLREQLERMELLSRITRAIGDRQGMQGLFKIVVDALESNLPIDFGCVCLYESPADAATIVATGSRGATLASEMGMSDQARVAVGENDLARCLGGELVYEPDTSKVKTPLARRLSVAGLSSLVIAPLRAEGQVFGLLLAARRGVDAFSAGDCEFLRQLTEHVALASHQTRLYHALQEAYDDLRQTQQSVLQQERLRALGEMASGIAHDINNALSPASLYTELLIEREANLSEHARDCLRTIKRAIGDVTQTVVRMREFSRPREPQLVLAQVDLNSMARQVISLTRVRWSDMPQERGMVIELNTELADNLPKIMGAESEIRDALTNLIFNAVDAMPQGGVLGVHTRVTTTPRSGEEPLRYAEIEVRDSGIGMDEETRRLCLEPFYTTKGERGTGMGLAMVYGMTQRHSAELAIESSRGSGTAVRLIFPIPVVAPVLSHTAQSLRTEARQLRILIADDDPLLIQSLRDILEAEGHQVTAAEGGRAAIDEFAAAKQLGEPFSAVITDLGMPHVDGRRVAVTVRAMSASVAIILLTGWGQRLLDEKEVPPGVDRVLSKPPKLQELRAALVELTAREPKAG